MTAADAFGIAWPVLVAAAAFCGAWGGVSARLNAVETSAKRAHERIDNHIETKHMRI